MEKQIVLCDTSVIIDYYNGNTNIMAHIDKIGFRNLAINSITYGEALYGSLNKSDFKKWCAFLDKFTLIYLNEDISEYAVSLLKNYVLSHKLHIADALIAATAIYYEMPLFTLNIKDFQYIKELKLSKV